MTSDPKPCPFCGGPGYAVWVVGSPYWKVRCDSYRCGISGPPAKSHGWAVRKWNRDARKETADDQ